jgi:Kef-type K+ transport system membrane component KefB
MGIIPILAIMGGRCWPYLLCLPITALPIAGKTLRDLSYRSEDLNVIFGWVIIFIIPIALTIWFVIKQIKNSESNGDGSQFIRETMVYSTVFYFIMNWAIFRFPWPWAEWTGRTPSGIIFSMCAASIILLAIYFNPRQDKWQIQQ